MRLPLHYKISILSALLVVLVSILVMEFSYSESMDVLFEHEETDLQQEGLLACRKVEAHLEQLRRDALTLSASSDVKKLASLVHELNKAKTEENEQDVEKEINAKNDLPDPKLDRKDDLMNVVESLFFNLCVNQILSQEAKHGAKENDSSDAPLKYAKSELRPYYQVRMIDANGKEICRLQAADDNESEAEEKEGGEIQGQDDRKLLTDFYDFNRYENDDGPMKTKSLYFQAARDLYAESKGNELANTPRAYLSQIDLNRESKDGVVDVDYERPVMRAWVPLLGNAEETGAKPEFLGIVIVNLDFAKIKTEISATARQLVYMTNDEGQFLIHPDRDREFAWDLNEKDDDFKKLKADLKEEELWKRSHQQEESKSELSVDDLVNERLKLLKRKITEEDPWRNLQDEKGGPSITDSFKPDFTDVLVKDSSGKANLRLAYRGWQTSGVDSPVTPEDQFYLLKYPSKRKNDSEVPLNGWKKFKKSFVEQETQNPAISSVRFPSLYNVGGHIIFSAESKSYEELEKAIQKAEKESGFTLPKREYCTLCENFISFFFRIYLNPNTEEIERMPAVNGGEKCPYDKHISLVMAFSKDEMNSELKATQQTIFFRGFVIALIVSLVGMISGLLITRRLRDLKTVADELGKGHFSTEIKQESGLSALFCDEVSDLVGSFKVMRNEVVEREKEIREINATLEQKVVERTEELNVTLEELKVARDKAEHLSVAKDGFLASVSHELRNPLNQVTGFCQLLELSDLKEAQRDDVAKIRTAAVRQLGLVNDILDYQKIIMDGMSMEPSNVPVGELLQAVYDSQRFRADSGGNNLIIACDEEESETVYADRKRLMQVLENLVGNALKFTHKGTVILSAELESSGPNQFWLFKVKDNGRGMHAREIEQLFQPFKKLASSEGNQEGTGLGLVIAKGLSEAMNGDISCNSTFGKGTTFYVRIPQTPDDKIVNEFDSTGQTTLIPPGDTNGSKQVAPVTPIDPTDSNVVRMFSQKAKSADVMPLDHTILVIDDEADSRELISRYLGKLHFSVTVADGGVDGLKKAKSLRPSLITLDARMPEIDGWAILAALKSDPETSHIPVVMVTVSDQVRRAQVLGANAFIHKPIDWEQFSEVVMQQISGSKEREILVIDDDPESREIVRRILEQADWKVIEAENGLKALELLETRRPSAIVLDLIMPVMDGFEFLEKYSENADYRSIPIIVQTAKETTNDEHKAMSGVVVQVIKKGDVTTGDLLKQLEEITG